MTKPTKFMRCDALGGRGWKLECDPSQVFPEDPGMGTPLLVHAPNGETGTIFCALGEGVVSGDDQEIPSAVYKWLERVQAEAEAYVYGEVQS